MQHFAMTYVSYMCFPSQHLLELLIRDVRLHSFNIAIDVVLNVLKMHMCKVNHVS